MSNFKQDLQETIRCSTEQQKFIGNKEYIIDEYADKTSALVLQLIQNRLGIDASLLDLQWNIELYNVLTGILAPCFMARSQLVNTTTNDNESIIITALNDSFDEMVNAIGLHLIDKTELLSDLRDHSTPLLQAYLPQYIKVIVTLVGFILLMGLAITVLALGDVLPLGLGILAIPMMLTSVLGILGSIIILFDNKLDALDNTVIKEKLALNLMARDAIKDCSDDEKSLKDPLYLYLNRSTFFGNASAPAADNGAPSFSATLVTPVSTHQ